MFCPRCGAENNLEQKYCRHCGLQLAAARIALQGSMDEALTKYKKGEDLLSGGSVTLIIFILIALANIFLNSGARNWGVVINLLLGLLITLPMVLTGLVRLRRARHALEGRDEQSQVASDHSHEYQALAPSADSTNRLLSPLEVRGSVTERTTLHLKSPERKQH